MKSLRLMLLFASSDQTENDDVEYEHKADVDEWCLCMISTILRIEWAQRTD